MTVKHPAVFSDSIIVPIASLVKTYELKNVLDPFAGTGKIAEIKKHGYQGKVTCNEIEQEWILLGKEKGYDVDEWYCSDACFMDWAKDNQFDCVATSPTYGNRMADHHNAKDLSRRITYRHSIGRPLSRNNTGQMQWGGEYKKTHYLAYKECYRVLCDKGYMILNVSNHIRNGREIDVVGWHCKVLSDIGFLLLTILEISTPRMRYGRNRELRVNQEVILVCVKREKK